MFLRIQGTLENADMSFAVYDSAFLCRFRKVTLSCKRFPEIHEPPSCLFYKLFEQRQLTLHILGTKLTRTYTGFRPSLWLKKEISLVTEIARPLLL